MRKYGNLLTKIAEEYCIPKGTMETESIWKARLVYSVLGRMAYASLWDTQEDGNPVSIEHLKKRVVHILNSYRKAYPEINLMFPTESEAVADEIYDLFLKSGIVYHRPRHITAAAYSSASVENIVLIRGGAVEENVSVCGLGTYSENPLKATTTVQTMFQISEQPLCEEWTDCIQNARWHTVQKETQAEYLRMMPPFNRGYWEEMPLENGTISIMRKGMHGSQLYYLYRIENGRMEESQLPTWRTEKYQYRSLANACLAYAGTLPSICFHLDGEIVIVFFDYLLPLEEQAFFNLYSWPSSCVSLPCNFKRVCTKTVFHALRTMLENRGFLFKEV